MKLEFELVSDSCWHSNLRTILSKSAWDIVRKEAICRFDNRCAICGRKVKRLEGHEKWSYDEINAVQKLEDVLAVCHDCHSVIHIGRTQLVSDIERAEKHFMKVNQCSYAEYIKALGKANEDHKRRNQISEWKLDLTYLKNL